MVSPADSSASSHSPTAEDSASKLALAGGLKHVGLVSIPKPSLRQSRRSACADSALRAELARIESMTIEQRIKAALSMRERFSWLPTVSKEK